MVLYFLKDFITSYISHGWKQQGSFLLINVADCIDSIKKCIFF